MNLDAKVDNDIFRKDHPIILACLPHQASIKGVRLAYDASGYEAGRVLARDAGTGYYAKYDNGGASGVSTAACVLLHEVAAEEFPSATGTSLARGIFAGEVFKAKLVGNDTASDTDLRARTIDDATGTSILRF